MTRLLSGLFLLLSYCSAYAQTAAEKVPVEATASPTVVIIFVVIFVGFCVGFVWMVYSASRKKAKQEAAKGHNPSGKAT
jgi:heme/copper-type cytochrome/quinol oxidase subunit 2